MDGMCVVASFSIEDGTIPSIIQYVSKSAFSHSRLATITYSMLFLLLVLFPPTQECIHQTDKGITGVFNPSVLSLAFLLNGVLFRTVASFSMEDSTIPSDIPRIPANPRFPIATSRLAITAFQFCFSCLFRFLPPKNGYIKPVSKESWKRSIHLFSSSSFCWMACPRTFLVHGNIPPKCHSSSPNSLSHDRSATWYNCLATAIGAVPHHCCHCFLFHPRCGAECL
mmetsp:Transcript_20243/g.36367  ORF Transcript_20243/g.36367 Transcript_20243/m.36367 type:complete len:225 (+) Transcript_20243:245-919(+)